MKRCDVCGAVVSNLEPYGWGSNVLMACRRCIAKESSHQYITRRLWARTSQARRRMNAVHRREHR